MRFRQRVIKLVQQIPLGKVASYGQIAALVGTPRAAITVGQILHHYQQTVPIPWQRVINSQGYISTTCLEHPAQLQAELLRAEGVAVVRRRRLWWVDFTRYRWQKFSSVLG